MIRYMPTVNNFCANYECDTYCIIVEDECVLIFVEVVQGALRYAILDLNAALDILLV